MALFTHSYYSHTAPEMNPGADYIADAKIVRVDYQHWKTSPTDEKRELVRQGYVFCQWLHVAYASLALYVKPSEMMIAALTKRVGHADLSAMVVKPTADPGVMCVNCGSRVDASFTQDYIAGSMSREDMDLIIRKAEFYGDGSRLICDMFKGMKRSGPQFKSGWARAVYVAIGYVTNQRSLVADAESGRLDDWYLYGSHMCFVRKNWPVTYPHRCDQCGGTDH